MGCIDKTKDELDVTVVAALDVEPKNDEEPTVDAAAVEAAATPVVNDAFDAAAVEAVGVGLEEQTAFT